MLQEREVGVVHGGINPSFRAEPGCFTCRGGRQAFGSPSPAQVSAALGATPIHAMKEEFTGQRTRYRTEQHLARRFPCVSHTRDRSAGGGFWVD
jgi:hypothetical protein